MKIITKSIEETAKVAEDFIKKISQTTRGQATVVGLFGDLGSGKTTFTQAVGAFLGVQEVMTSPTFVIEKRYSLPATDQNKTSYLKLIHIDAYRLDSGHEALTLDLINDLADPNNLIFIEWPERISDVLPPDLLKIYFKAISEFEREIVFSF